MSVHWTLFHQKWHIYRLQREYSIKLLMILQNFQTTQKSNVWMIIYTEAHNHYTYTHI